MAVRYGFRRFGDDDDFSDLDVDELLRLLGDDFMESGDLDEAMDRLLRDGFNDTEGNRIEGLRDLMERARAKRRELEQQADPGELARGLGLIAEADNAVGADHDEGTLGKAALVQHAESGAGRSLGLEVR